LQSQTEDFSKRRSENRRPEGEKNKAKGGGKKKGGTGAIEKRACKAGAKSRVKKRDMASTSRGRPEEGEKKTQEWTG